MSAHTPGPWTWFDMKRSGVHSAGDPCMKGFVGGDGQGFAHTVGLMEPRDTANARLIARAPEMYAFIVEAAGRDCHRYDKHFGQPPCGECESCRARAIVGAVEQP